LRERAEEVTILAQLKALKHALALWPLALIGAAGCASSSGSSSNGDDQTGSVSASIVGGHLDTMTKGVVALGLAAHDQIAVTCTGSLLAPNLVLTARHCVSQIGDGKSPKVDCARSQFTAKYDPRLMFVSTDSAPQSTSQLYAIKEVREAPGSSKVCGNDIALVILSGSGVPNSEAKPLEPVLDHSPTAKQSFAAVGYGLQDPNDEQGATAGTRMRFDRSSVYCIGAKCPAEAGAEDDEWVGDSPVCSGDSGGPALDGNGRVLGVTSRGDPECTYALYSDVAHWAAFVRSTAIAAATSGNYTPPSWATEGPSDAADGGGSGTGDSPSDSAGTTSPPTGPVGPTIDPLGSACAGDCPGTYQCFTASGTPPGICVPPCSPAADSCPARYTCSETLQVCTPTQSAVKTAKVSGSCAVNTGPHSPPGGSAFAGLLALGVLWLGRRRRRAA
jgi:MYXO-CTERM domain-containing protein